MAQTLKESAFTKKTQPTNQQNLKKKNPNPTQPNKNQQ